MDFYSPEFFAFSLAVLALFFVVPARLRWVVLLAASYSFYAAFKAAYLGILVFCTLAAYGGALAMNRCEARQTRRLMLIAGLVCQLGILGIFKYVSFLDASLGQLLGWGGMAYSGTALSLIVPVGISFYVFQNVSYLVDVYRRDVPAERHPGIFAAYVAFFPKLLSGPIERASQFLPQLSEHSRFDAERFTNGLKLVCWGLFKKLVIAERLAAFVNVVYADPQAYSGVSLALACVFYSFQIYCDFSGYTDIAIGLGQMFGLRLTDNFNRTLQRDVHFRFLAALAHLALFLAARLSLHSAGRKPRGRPAALPQLPHRLWALRPVARRKLDVCRLGSSPRILSRLRAHHGKAARSPCGRCRPGPEAGAGTLPENSHHFYSGHAGLDIFPRGEPFPGVLHSRTSLFRLGKSLCRGGAGADASAHQIPDGSGPCCFVARLSGRRPCAGAS